jgi:hypothetical protein
MFTSRDGHALTYSNAPWLSQDRFADDAFEFYLDWREAAYAWESAYRHWAALGVARERRPGVCRIHGGSAGIRRRRVRGRLVPQQQFLRRARH